MQMPVKVTGILNRNIQRLITTDEDTIYSKTCLNRTPLGLKNLFSLDRCLVYAGSNYILYIDI